MVRTHQKIGLHLHKNNIEKVRGQINTTGKCFSQIVNEALNYYFTHPTTEVYDRPKQHTTI